MPEQTLRQRMTRMAFVVGPGIAYAESVRPRVEPLGDRLTLRLCPEQWSVHPCLIVEMPDGTGPAHDQCVVRVGLLEGMEIAQEMDPAALVFAVIAVVPALEVRDQMPGEGT